MIKSRRLFPSLLSAVLATALVLSAASSAMAQSGVLFVRVEGPGGPLPGARVEVLLQEQLLGWGDTDAQGRARIGPIPGGTFSVRVQAMGHRELVVDSVRVEPGTPRALEVTLELAPIEMEGLTVRAERVQIQRENTEFSTQVNQVAIELLPVSFTATDLVALTPGARPGHIWGGASFQANSYRLDGLSANHPGLGGDLLQPSIYWIDRVEVRGLGAGAGTGGWGGVRGVPGGAGGRGDEERDERVPGEPADELRERPAEQHEPGEHGDRHGGGGSAGRGGGGSGAHRPGPALLLPVGEVREPGPAGAEPPGPDR